MDRRAHTYLISAVLSHICTVQVICASHLPAMCLLRRPSRQGWLCLRPSQQDGYTGGRANKASWQASQNVRARQLHRESCLQGGSQAWKEMGGVNACLLWFHSAPLFVKAIRGTCE